MIEKLIEKHLSLDAESRILIYDTEGFSKIFDYKSLVRNKGFYIVDYTDVEKFRYDYETEIRYSSEKYAIIITDENLYVPYDVKKSCYIERISVAELFPKLHATTVSEHSQEIDLIAFAYDNINEYADTQNATLKFIDNVVFSPKVIREYCNAVSLELSEGTFPLTYQKWIELAKKKARLEYYASRVSIELDLQHLDLEFEKFINDGYNKLSTAVNSQYPPLLSKTLDLITRNKEKVALIVMDGMSLFDFEIISRYLIGIEYEYKGTFALIPTITSISRQSLLSGKLPAELIDSFSLVNEEKEFRNAALEIGYKADEIQYERGISPDIGIRTKIISIIINEVDDIVHGNCHDLQDMYGRLSNFSAKQDITNLIKKLSENGFTIYITADHGNTPVIGMGKKRFGVEIKSRSTRMLVSKNFADGEKLCSENIFPYAGYYLNKDYKYFICESGCSFDSLNSKLMGHGGISIDEVIVPFIKITKVN